MLINSGKNLGFNPKIIHFIFLSLFFLLSATGSAQIDIKHYTTATDTFYWKRYIHIPKPPKVNLKRFSVSQAAKKIESFLARNISQFPQFSNDSIPQFSVKDLKKCLFPIDINGDNLTDMIFSGFSGGESDIMRIWLNRTDSFELIFEDYQYISKFVKAGNKLVEMQTGDPGCCANYLYFTRDYRVEQEKGEPVFVKGKQTVSYQYTEEPSEYYPVPVPFIAKADTMMLRASSALQNEPFNPVLDTFGNIIAKYRTKARGYALAYKTNGKGSDWFFVEISPDVSPSASILYDIDKIPTFIRGWVFSQSIQLQQK
jgi:hypothetical protein